MTATPGAHLAYEHEVELEAAPDTIGPRITAVRDACTSERFGACSVLAIEATNGEYGRSYITVRAVPQAIEPLVALASDGANPKRRTTKAEDLADAVADVAQRRDLATRQRERLLELSERRDLGVGDI
ncbi:MAG TPA: DUF4349 domain-containing protein, partial [Xanthomonadales bacterium]|nr:DUF4349 domain-containing protein [Xanthomonadales bacterium]